MSAKNIAVIGILIILVIIGIAGAIISGGSLIESEIQNEKDKEVIKPTIDENISLILKICEQIVRGEKDPLDMNWCIENLQFAMDQCKKYDNSTACNDERIKLYLP